MRLTIEKTATAQSIAFFVPGKPVAKGRPKAAARGKFITLYTPQSTVSYESKVALCAAQALDGQPLLAGAVEVVMRIMLPIPASWSAKKRLQAEQGSVLPKVKPDMDNVVKAIFDALNGIVWRDDTQVVDMIVRKRYAATPGVQMIVMPVEISQ